MAVEDRGAVASALETLRPLLLEKKVWLFLGEEVSTLPNEEKDWWTFLEDILDDKTECINRIQSMETANQKIVEAMRYLYNTLSTVATWPGIVSLNLDNMVEKFLWRGDSNFEKIRLDQLAELNSEKLFSTVQRKMFIKVFGDTGLVTCIEPKLKSIMNSPSKVVEALLRRLFNENTFLFLGVDIKKYRNFFTNFVMNAKIRHYMLQRKSPTMVERYDSLEVLCSDLDLWEFVMYLSPGQQEKDMIPGQVYERSYLATQRQQYLLQQLDLESQATEMVFHTVQISSALATEESITVLSLPKLHDIYRKDPLGTYDKKDVIKAYDAMMARRTNLIKIIDSGKALVKAVFLYKGFCQEIEPKNLDSEEKRNERCIAVRKYADAILRSKSVLNPNSVLELMVLAGLTDDEMKIIAKETFAVIKMKGGIDEALCYAETANPGEKQLQTHLIVINGPEVANKRRICERSMAKAWNHRDSILRLSAKLMEANEQLDAIDPNTIMQLQSLHNVISMLDRSIDACSLVHLGAGSFGEVYKAIWNGMPVALKFLKEAALSSDIARFEMEFQRLKQAEHENIVKVYKLTVENNKLGLIMELIDGGTVRQHLIDHGPQEYAFTHRCAMQMATAINHLHNLHIVHRDIKTDNILVTKDLMTFKLADFGLARVLERTEQYKSVKGTFRFMAPEILQGRDGSARYSLRVDVYSYGLVLLEVISGSPVFEGLTREELEIGKRDGSLAPTIPDWCEEKHGTTLSTVIRFAIAPAERRPDMNSVLQMLKTDKIPLNGEVNQEGCSIFCLGTGKGATTVLYGEPSSSFVVMKNHKPILLVDLGFGVTLSFRNNIGKDMNIKHIYITHNHADHAAELPVLLAVLHAQRQLQGASSTPVILAAQEVMERVRTHRVPEVCNEIAENQLAEWRKCNPFPKRSPIDKEGEFEISVLPSQHSEICYGFLLYQNGQPLLSYSGDSGFNKNLYNALFTAPNVVLDARTVSTFEHAGFADVQKYLEQGSKDCRVFITGYGQESEYPEDGILGTTQLRRGQEYPLQVSHESQTFPRSNVELSYTSTTEGLKVQ